jgi:hypothetical protein
MKEEIGIKELLIILGVGAFFLIAAIKRYKKMPTIKIGQEVDWQHPFHQRANTPAEQTGNYFLLGIIILAIGILVAIKMISK